MKLGQQRVQFDAQEARRLLYALERDRVGDAHARVVTRTRAALLQLGFDLRARAVHQHQAYAGAAQQVDVLRQHRELAVGHDFAAEGDDEGLAAKGVEIRRRRAEPGDELAMDVGRHARSG
jgi:hypothetical protein